MSKPFFLASSQCNRTFDSMYNINCFVSVCVRFQHTFGKCQDWNSPLPPSSCINSCNFRLFYDDISLMRICGIKFWCSLMLMAEGWFDFFPFMFRLWRWVISIMIAVNEEKVDCDWNFDWELVVFHVLVCQNDERLNFIRAVW